MSTVYPVSTDIKVPDSIPLAWLSEADSWVDQWPILESKLFALKELVLERLALGHLEPSISGQNTPIIVIKEKSWK